MSGEDGYSSSGNNSGSSSSSISDGPWVEEFEDLCSSEDLYLDELKRFIEGISLDDFDLSHSSFLHRACMNENVTLEIVMYLLRLYPGTINTSFDLSDDEYASISASSYPLHLACFNKDCPNDVIEKLLYNSPGHRHIMKSICFLEFNWGNTDMSEVLLFIIIYQEHQMLTTLLNSWWPVHKHYC